MGSFDDVRRAFRGTAPLAADADGRAADTELKVATAVLLLETAHGDAEYARDEETTIRRALEREFGLSRSQARDLLEKAHVSRPVKGDFSKSSGLVQERYSVEQRMRIMGLIWKVVYADGSVEASERKFARYLARITGLTPDQAAMARARVERGRI
ncbi:MAG: hypothetical protein CME06_16270 [Gemmatimonadetes bacterium]|nr:hypothetical protein [Gemmatimonadota bacterium]